jgi:hypothetical protein
MIIAKNCLVMPTNKQYISVEKIQDFLHDTFEKELFVAACQSLCEKDNKLRFNNFACGIRELTRHFLNRLSDTNEVVKCHWYKDEIPGKTNTPTRNQKIKFAIQGGLSEEYVFDTLHIDITPYNKALSEAFGLLNKYVHVNPDTFGLKENDVKIHVDEIANAFVKFFSTIQACREKIIEQIETHIQQTVEDHSLSECIDEIDELSTHHHIEEIYSNSIKVTSLTSTNIELTVNGSIDVHQQFGSDGDVKRGDGLEMDDNFPFESKLIGELSQFPLYKFNVLSFDVNTDSHYQ